MTEDKRGEEITLGSYSLGVLFFENSNPTRGEFGKLYEDVEQILLNRSYASREGESTITRSNQVFTDFYEKLDEESEDSFEESVIDLESKVIVSYKMDPVGERFKYRARGSSLREVNLLVDFHLVPVDTIKNVMRDLREVPDLILY